MPIAKFRTITNKYTSICRRCGETVPAGQSVRWAKGKGVYHLSNECATVELTHKEQYGQCEDAPCCGCCGVNLYGGTRYENDNGYYDTY
jgi:hypothetical protein